MLINYANELKKYIKELKLEINMRKKVWRRISGKEHKFIDITQQQRYNTMRLILKVLSEMSPNELEAIVKRIQSKSIQGKQQELFK